MSFKVEKLETLDNGTMWPDHIWRQGETVYLVSNSGGHNSTINYVEQMISEKRWYNGQHSTKKNIEYLSDALYKMRSYQRDININKLLGE